MRSDRLLISEDIYLNEERRKKLKIKQLGKKNVCKIKYSLKCDPEVVYISFDGLEQTGIVKQCFTTRLGGISQGEFSTMNLSYTRGDTKEAVDENYRRVATVLSCDVNDFVCSHQTHTTNVKKVSSADGGKGVTRERDFSDIDGLITNEPGVVLATFYADCVPLYIVDPVHKAIGLSHSGWRGTVQKMGKVTLEAMAKEYGTKPEDVRVAIGPSICQECYEVSEDVALAFLEAFPEDMEKEEQYAKHYQDGKMENCLCYQKANGKYQLNLWYANYRVFRDAGVPDNQIEITDICTCCNPDFLFSHRASHGKRGNLGAFLTLK